MMGGGREVEKEKQRVPGRANILGRSLQLEDTALRKSKK